MNVNFEELFIIVPIFAIDLFFEDSGVYRVDQREESGIRKIIIVKIVFLSFSVFFKILKLLFGTL